MSTAASPQDMLATVLKKYELVMGLEVHAQLKTQTKLMSSASNVFGDSPNSAVSTIDTGMPGALPVLNKEAVRMAVKMGLALNCEIQKESIFSRKHYFYPDLPKGYQISQFDRPYALEGAVRFFFNNEEKKIGLVRIHLEEDAGKNLHFDEKGISLVDLNRSSVPLIEIVSKPDLRSPEEAVAYLKALRLVLRYLDICEGDLEKGNFRCDANVSLRPWGQKEFGTRVELKNINSFRNLERAVTFEALRQFEIIETGGKIHQETRLWDANANQSRGMRSKEEAADYRYMPEPDLLPLRLDPQWIQKLKSELPEMPIERAGRFVKVFHRSPYDAEVLTASSALADYYESVAKTVGDDQLASTFIQTNVLAQIKDVERDFDSFYPDSKNLSELLLKVKDGSLSLGMAKEAFEAMQTEKKSAAQIISEKGLAQISDEKKLLEVIDSVMATNTKQLADYRSGKDKLFGFFMGQCQKTLGGKGHPVLLKELLEKKLKA